MNEELSDEEQLHFAVQDGNISLVKKILAQGVLINSFDDIGKTPLHYASTSGRLDLMKLLISHGADVNAHDKEKIGDTPLGEVAQNCSYEVAKLLIDSGADPTIPGWMKLTALHKAQERKKTVGVKVFKLLEKAAKNLGKRKTL